MCDFCKIISKELDAHIVCETDKNIAFLDYEPINEGHVLIVPKIHVDSITDVADDILVDINDIIRKLVRAYRKVYKTDGYSIMQNGGKCCDYGHFHMHVFPRFDGDGFGWTDSCRPSEYSARIASVLREEI